MGVISYKEKVINLLTKKNGINKSDIDCNKIYDRKAMENLYHVNYVEFSKDGKSWKIITLSKGLTAIRAWKAAWNKISNQQHTMKCNTCKFEIYYFYKSNKLSLAIYLQQIGRGLRNYDFKNNNYQIIDL